MAEDLEVEGGKKKGKLMIIIIAAVVILAGGGAAAFFLLGGEDPEAAEAADEEVVEEVVVNTEGVAMYVSMPRPFQFNAPGIARERLVQIEVQLMVRGMENEDRARKHIPMIEGTLLQVFSASNADDLVTDVGKVALREKATAQVRQVMNELERNPVVEQVLFTGFVIQ